MRGGIKLVKVHESRRQSLRDCLGEDEDERPERTSSRAPKKNRKAHKAVPESVTRGQAVVLHLQRHYLNFSLNSAEESITCSIYKVEPIDAFTSDAVAVPDVIDGTAFRDSPAIVTNFNSKSASSTVVQADSLEQSELVFLERFDLVLFFLKQLQIGDGITLEHDEVMKLDGAKQWSTFGFTAVNSEDIPEDWYKQIKSHGTPKTCGAVIAMDCLRPRFEKYADKHLRWLIHKAYAGFSIAPGNEVATTHWGCEGRMANNHNVIFCVQSIAATLANKQLKYFVGSDELKCDKGKKIVDAWHKKGTPLHGVFTELVGLCESNPDFSTFYDSEAEAERKAVVKELKAEEKAKAKVDSMALGSESGMISQTVKRAKGDDTRFHLLTSPRRTMKSMKQQGPRLSASTTAPKFKTDDYSSVYFPKRPSSVQRSISLSPHLAPETKKSGKAHSKLLVAPSQETSSGKKSKTRSKSLVPRSKSRSPISDSSRPGSLRAKKIPSSIYSKKLTLNSKLQTDSEISCVESRSPRHQTPALELSQTPRPPVIAATGKAAKVKTEGKKGRKVLRD
eukprot:GEMP01021259.1.p1 GENE.GEMP01021259.1~~GEMP01021259.1.p1  ORF type:complete len:563 (+),score=101.77 GEMP01021259.1:115-1803(+)